MPQVQPEYDPARGTVRYRDTATGEWFDAEMCECRHTRADHAHGGPLGGERSPAVYGEGACEVEGCGCPRFRHASYLKITGGGGE